MIKALNFSIFLFAFATFSSVAVIACEEKEPEAPDEGERVGEELPVPMADIADLPVNVPYVLPEFTEEELEKFAEINYKAAERDLDPVEDAYEYTELIKEEGLSTARYREIYVALEREPTLRVKMQELMDELHEN